MRVHMYIYIYIYTHEYTYIHVDHFCQIKGVKQLFSFVVGSGSSGLGIRQGPERTIVLTVYEL